MINYVCVFNVVSSLITFFLFFVEKNSILQKRLKVDMHTNRIQFHFEILHQERMQKRNEYTPPPNSQVLKLLYPKHSSEGDFRIYELVDSSQ